MTDGPVQTPAPRRGFGKALFLCAVLACLGWLALNAGTSTPPLISKRETPPAAGVIGAEDRVPLQNFTPENPTRFPGWEQAIAGVVRISCNGVATGGGVLIGAGDRMLTAAHVFLDSDGRLEPHRRSSCMAVHPGGDIAMIDTVSFKSGPFRIPQALDGHFSVGITQHDWAIVRLSHIPRGARPLPIAELEQLTLEDGHPILNISGATDNYETPGFLAQVCAYRGVPPSASALDDTGEVFGRVTEAGEELLVARYDCDIGAGGSGSPVIGWHDGAPFVWGVLTDSLRGRDRCPDIGRTFCYTAGPLSPAMDVVP